MVSIKIESINYEIRFFDCHPFLYFKMFYFDVPQYQLSHFLLLSTLFTGGTTFSPKFWKGWNECLGGLKEFLPWLFAWRGLTMFLVKKRLSQHIGIIRAFCLPGRTYEVFPWQGVQKKLLGCGLLGGDQHPGWHYVFFIITMEKKTEKNRNTPNFLKQQKSPAETKRSLILPSLLLYFTLRFFIVYILSYSKTKIISKYA